MFLRLAWLFVQLSGASPTPVEFQGHYAGFAIWPPRNGVNNSFTVEPQTTDVWKCDVELLKATNNFWETYAAKIQLNYQAREHVFIARGIRPTSSRSTFVRASMAIPKRGGLFSRLMSWLSPTESATPNDTSEWGNIHFASEDSADIDRCHITGVLMRVNDVLEDPDATNAGEVSPPVEGQARKFIRSPDLVGRFLFSDTCPFTGKSLSIATRKISLEYLKTQQAFAGAIVSLKSLMEILLYARQFNYVKPQPVLLKTSAWMIGLCIFYDAFEAQFFFAQQNSGHDMTFMSTLSFVGIVKVVLVCVLQMRWLILLWKEKAVQRQHALGNTDPQAWILDMNSGIRSSAALMVLVLLISSNIFNTMPELILFGFAFYMMPQIWKNAYHGMRHPLKTWFLIGVAACRTVLPCLLWNPRLDRYWRVSTPYTPTPYADLYPPWFTGSNAPNIPAEFVDMFGTIKRRPNAFALTLFAIVMGAQIVVLLLQSWWSPRVLIPQWVCEKYLPAVFDYELDVPRAAAARQEVDPECTSVDCVICFTTVKFMDCSCVVTPCQHFFHRECLLKWMEVKLECPTCRNILPPY